MLWLGAAASVTAFVGSLAIDDIAGWPVARPRAQLAVARIYAVAQRAVGEKRAWVGLVLHQHQRRAAFFDIYCRRDNTR